MTHITLPLSVLNSGHTLDPQTMDIRRFMVGASSLTSAPLLGVVLLAVIFMVFLLNDHVKCVLEVSSEKFVGELSDHSLDLFGGALRLVSSLKP